MTDRSRSAGIPARAAALALAAALLFQVLPLNLRCFAPPAGYGTADESFFEPVNVCDADTPGAQQAGEVLCDASFPSPPPSLTGSLGPPCSDELPLLGQAPRVFRPPRCAFSS